MEVISGRFFHKNIHILQNVPRNVLKCIWIVIIVAMTLLDSIEMFVWYTEGLDDQVLLHGFISTNMTNKVNRIRWNYKQNMNTTEQLHIKHWYNIMKPYEWPNSKWPSATCEWHHRGILSVMTSEHDYGLNARNVKYVNLTNIKDKTQIITIPVSISPRSIRRIIIKPIFSYCVKQFVNKHPFNVSNNSNNHINFNPNRLLHIVYCS